jgi:very-short-patch-repair endonuclease
MPKIKNEFFLTQQHLQDFVTERFSTRIIPNKYFGKFRPDLLLPEINLCIEFDGFFHYQTAKCVLRDIRKDEFLNSCGIAVIRVPYFVQLDEKIVKLLFGKYIKDTSAYNDYPHGFHDKAASLPADFCSLGVLRFQQDLVKFDIVKAEILNSLEKKVILLGDRRFVFPSLFGKIDEF